MVFFKSWSCNICFNFLLELLDFIKSYCRHEGCFYLFERSSGSAIINCKITTDQKYNFIRDWFASEI
jgi:hypothetical protein